MIEKMTFVTLTGPKYTIDQTVERYLTKYDIHLENAMLELSGVTTLKPFVEVNPYKDKVTVLKDYISKIKDTTKTSKTLTKEYKKQKEIQRKFLPNELFVKMTCN